MTFALCLGMVAASMSLFAAASFGEIRLDSRASLAEILRDLANADSVLVERTSAPRPPLRAISDRVEISDNGEAQKAPRAAALAPEVAAEVGRPGNEWAARFARVLALGRPLFQSCPSAPSDTASRLMLWVRAHHKTRVNHFQVCFDERCAVITWSFEASLDVSAVAETLLALAREALPRDSLFQRLPPRVALTAPTSHEPRTVVAPPTAEDAQRLGDDDVEELPEAIVHPKPVLPQAARAAGVSGTVLVQVFVGKDGQVQDVRVVKSIPDLDAAAIDCARRWKFKPALSHGQPVPVWVAVPLKFTAE